MSRQRPGCEKLALSLVALRIIGAFLARVKKPNGRLLSYGTVSCLVVFVCAISHRSEWLKDTVSSSADRTVVHHPLLNAARVFSLTFSEGGHRGGGLLDTSPHKGPQTHTVSFSGFSIFVVSCRSEQLLRSCG
jgi:hypothetical protein